MHSELNPILFSIVVPTYNRAHLISKTLDSILAQTYTNFEIIVVDDGSTDNTEQLISEKYAQTVRYYKKVNEERSIARNFGTQVAKGDYVVWFDSDDIMYSNYLSEAKLIIQNKNKPELIALSHQYKTPENIIISNKVIPKNVNELLHKGNYFACNAVIVRKDVARNNPFNVDRDLKVSEDYELWLRLGCQFKFHTSAQYTWALVIHSERSMASMSNARKTICSFEKFLKYTTENKQLMDYFGENASYFIMKNYLILAVDLAHNNHKKEAFHYLKLAVKTNKKVFLTKTFYATVKHLIF